ncbi:hypothetical protein FACS189449_11220 [Alphaproteobacteria bacterium]|nr:hypothetical protein FACS189449_11220 [Alphaproteobacteria bacterium]
MEKLLCISVIAAVLSLDATENSEPKTTEAIATLSPEQESFIYYMPKDKEFYGTDARLSGIYMALENLRKQPEIIAKAQAMYKEKDNKRHAAEMEYHSAFIASDFHKEEDLNKVKAKRDDADKKEDETSAASANFENECNKENLLKRAEIDQMYLAVSDEIYNEMSRPPQEHTPEMAASEDLKKELESGDVRIHVDEVRYIDAETSIRGMKLSEARERELINLVNLTEGADRDRRIETAIEKLFTPQNKHAFTFEDAELMAKVREDLGANRSRTYQNLILSLIAWSEASSPKVYDEIMIHAANQPAKRKMNFTYDMTLNDHSNFYSEISLCYQKDTLHSSLFGQSSAIATKDGLFQHLDPKGYRLFHEIGHTILGNIATADLILASDSELPIAIASKLAYIEANENVFLNQIDFIKEGEREHPELVGPFVDEYNRENKTHCDRRTAKALIDRLGKIYDSKTKKTNALALAANRFNKSEEILQITGVHCARHFNPETRMWKNILYINKLSDFALCAEMGWPIRYDHSEIAMEHPGAKMGRSSREFKPFLDKFRACGQLVKCKGINATLHDALLRASVGYGLSEYGTRLAKYEEGRTSTERAEEGRVKKEYEKLCAKEELVQKEFEEKRLHPVETPIYCVVQ